MSQSVKEFVRQSGVEVRASNSNSNDDNFVRELEETMLRKERERAAGFRTPPDRFPDRSKFLFVFNETLSMIEHMKVLSNNLKIMHL